MNRDELISKLLSFPASGNIMLSVNDSFVDVEDINFQEPNIVITANTQPHTGTVPPDEPIITHNTPPPAKIGANVGNVNTQGKGNWFAGTSWG